MSEFSSERSEMSSVSEASVLVRQIAEPREVGDSVKAAIVRAAGRLGFSFTRTKDLWYSDAKRIDAHEIDRLREVAARAEAQMVVANLLVLRNRLSTSNADVHRQTVAALDEALLAMGASVGAVGVHGG